MFVINSIWTHVVMTCIYSFLVSTSNLRILIN